MGNPGGRPQSVTDEEILQHFRESHEHVTTTSEVAEALDVSRRTALRRLSRLAEQDDIERKDVGDRSAVWWLPDSPSMEEKRILEDDPLFDLPTAASGRSDVSENVDEHVADALGGEE